MTSNLKLSSSYGVPFSDPSLYRSIVGSLQYVTITRPELAFCVNKVCQFMQNPLDTYWKEVKRILRYLSDTSPFGLHLQRCSSLPLTGYSDFDYGFNPDDHKFTVGYGVYLGKNLISSPPRSNTLFLEVALKPSTEALLLWLLKSFGFVPF